MNIISRLAQRFSPRPPMQALPPAPDPLARFDGWANAATGLGLAGDRTRCNEFIGRVPKSPGELEAVYSYSKLMARVVDLEPNTCMAKGFTISELSGGDATDFEAEMLRLNAFRHIADAHRWARLYGGAIVFMQVNDGRQTREPVNESAIVSVHSLTVYDRTEVSVAEWNDNIGSQNHGMPEIYRVSTFGRMFEVHHSRVLRFDGARVSRSMRRSGGNHGFGTSVVDQVWDAFEQYGTTHAYLNGSVSKITQGILKLKGLNDSMKTSKFSSIANRLKALLRSMSTIGDIVIDSDGEDYSAISRPMTGFQEAAEVAEARLVGEVGIPKSLLMMQAPGGLANGENGGDWKYWAVHCGAVQQDVLEPECKKLVRLLFLSRNSAVADPPQTFTITWPSILQMSEAEKATIYATRAVGRSSDILAGVITAIEARKSDDVVETYHLDAEASNEEEAETASELQPQLPVELRVVGS